MMRKMILSLVLVLSLVLCVGTVLAEDITFEWIPNTENDLAGYRLYQSDTPGGQAIGGESSPDFVVGILAGTETVTITTNPTLDTTLYWIVTAYDNGDLESGKSNEISHYFNMSAPAAPGSLEKVDVQAANVYINGDVRVVEAHVGTLQVVQEKN